MLFTTPGLRGISVAMKMKNSARCALVGTALTMLTGCSYFSFTYTEVTPGEFSGLWGRGQANTLQDRFEFRGMDDDGLSYFQIHRPLWFSERVCTRSETRWNGHSFAKFPWTSGVYLDWSFADMTTPSEPVSLKKPFGHTRLIDGSEPDNSPRLIPIPGWKDSPPPPSETKPGTVDVDSTGGVIKNGAEPTDEPTLKPAK